MKHNLRLYRMHKLVLVLMSCGLVFSQASAQSIADFYRGKIVTIVVGSDATGEYDANARLLSRHLGRHIPGNPSIVIQNMPGASGITSANYLYTIAPKDGLMLGTFNKSMPLYQMTGMPNTKYKAQEFNWIGSRDHANNLVVVSSRTGIKTIEDATKKQATMGSIGIGGTMSTYPLILNNSIGTKFKLVQGYAGGQLVDLAMERGEVDGRGSYDWKDLKTKRADWLRDGKVTVLVQFGLAREADLPNVPIPPDLGRDEREKAALAFLSSDIMMGKPLMTPPGVPAERVAALRNAFDETMSDPQFLADARTADADVNPIKGADLQATVDKIVSTSPDIVALAKGLMAEK